MRVGEAAQKILPTNMWTYCHAWVWFCDVHHRWIKLLLLIISICNDSTSQCKTYSRENEGTHFCSSPVTADVDLLPASKIKMAFVSVYVRNRSHSKNSRNPPVAHPHWSTDVWGFPLRLGNEGRPLAEVALTWVASNSNGGGSSEFRLAQTKLICSYLKLRILKRPEYYSAMYCTW